MLAFFASSAFMASMYFLLSSSSWRHKGEEFIFNLLRCSSQTHTVKQTKMIYLHSVLFGLLHLFIYKLNQVLQLPFPVVNHHLTITQTSHTEYYYLSVQWHSDSQKKEVMFLRRPGETRSYVKRRHDFSASAPFPGQKSNWINDLVNSFIKKRSDLLYPFFWSTHWDDTLENLIYSSKSTWSHCAPLFTEHPWSNVWQNSGEAADETTREIWLNIMNNASLSSCALTLWTLTFREPF